MSHTYSLRTCLEVSLRILAPIMPYVADDLYKRLSTKFSEFLSVPSLMEAPYPMPEQVRIIGLRFNKFQNLKFVFCLIITV